ncbi:unnamed protein product, partial [Protopolystoma xenopodis]
DCPDIVIDEAGIRELNSKKRAYLSPPFRRGNFTEHQLNLKIQEQKQRIRQMMDSELSPSSTGSGSINLPWEEGLDEHNSEDILCPTSALPSLDDSTIPASISPTIGLSVSPLPSSSPLGSDPSKSFDLGELLWQDAPPSPNPNSFGAHLSPSSSLRLVDKREASIISRQPSLSTPMPMKGKSGCLNICLHAT